MKQLQTSLIAGMEFTYTGETKIHVVLRDTTAIEIIRLSHYRNMSMTAIVRDALEGYFQRQCELYEFDDKVAI